MHPGRLHEVSQKKLLVFLKVLQTVFVPPYPAMFIHWKFLINTQLSPETLYISQVGYGWNHIMVSIMHNLKSTVLFNKMQESWVDPGQTRVELSFSDLPCAMDHQHCSSN